MSLIDYYIKAADKKGVYALRSKNRKCYLFNDYALLRGKVSMYELDDKIRKLNELHKQKVNILPIVEYKITSPITKDRYLNDSYADGWILEVKARGHELHDLIEEININDIKKLPRQYKVFIDEFNKYAKNINEYAYASDRQIYNFIRDFKLIEENGFIINSTKPGNFFYDEENGFTFIDINVRHDKYVPDNIGILNNIFSTVLYSSPVLKVRNDDTFLKIPILPKEIDYDLEGDLKVLLEKLFNGMTKAGFTQREINTAFNRYNKKIGFVYKIIETEPVDKKTALDIINKMLEDSAKEVIYIEE